MTLAKLGRLCEAHGVGPEFTWATEASDKELYAGLFGHAAKVACLTYGVRPVVACPGMKLGEGHVCSDCYARRGRYGTHSSRKAQVRRMVAFLRDPGLWHRAVVGQLLGAIGEEYVRLHDSGDFFSVEYAEAWGQVADEVPFMFFAPTRNYRLKAFLPVLQWLNKKENFTIRPSALKVGEAAPEVPGLSAPANVVRGKGTCLAAEEHSTCEAVVCRDCWLDTERVIDFRRHY